MSFPPIRLQFRRVKGFDLQAISLAANGRRAVLCTRQGPWGNWWRVGVHGTAFECVSDFRADGEARGLPERARRELAGFNLACACEPDAPDCHVDVLLKWANRR